jgi:hypothetical protein
MAKKDDGHWMERAFSKNKGKFSRKAKRAGKSTKAMAREDAHRPGKLGKEARLAKIGMKYGGKRGKKRSSGRR